MIPRFSQIFINIYYLITHTHTHTHIYYLITHIMDATSLNNMFQNIYIPSTCAKQTTQIPIHHPTLIMQDYQTDTTHHLSCGCNNGACIEERAWWFNKNNSNSKPVSKPLLATKPSYSPRPVFKSSASSSSISTISSFFSSN